MGNYALLVGVYFVSGFDFSSYTLKDGLQIIAAVLGIIGSTYGAWTAFRYSKRQIAKRLLEYLNNHEKNVDEVRQLVVRHLRSGRPIDRTPELEMHQCVERAVMLAGRGEEETAERDLNAFVVVLTTSAEVGKRHMEIAKRQAATILVCAGLIAKGRGHIANARTAWRQALDENPDDAEAIRSLGEADLSVGLVDQAFEQFTRATLLAPDDKSLRAETASLKADYYKGNGNPLLELNERHDSGLHFDEVSEHGRAGLAYARAGEIEAQLGRIRQAPESFKKAYSSYHKANNREAAESVRERLSELGEDINRLPLFAEPSRWPSIRWQWVRLLLEVLLLGAACYVTFMR
jgi:tetratricopeptide (TPR) repeat protein